MCSLVCVFPLVDGPFRGFQGVPFDREQMTESCNNSITLMPVHAFIKCDHRPIRCALRKICSQISRNPEFCSGQIHIAVVACIYLVAHVEAAVMFSACAVIMMRCRFRIEVTLTEHWASACF